MDVGGGLDRNKCLVVIVLPENEWPKQGDPLFVEIIEGEGNCCVDEKGDIILGRGPKLGSGVTNRGEFFVLLDGGHRLPVLLKK